LNYAITNHASMRYAERIADKETLLDITAYVANNKEKIENDINKMIGHSKNIYTGRVGTKDNSIVDVYLSGTWVLLVDPNKNRVITLYKIDFGVGEDFNKQFIQKILERMEEHKKSLNEKKQKVSDERNAYVDIIKENEAQIAECKTIIKKLDKVNHDYQDVIDKIDSQCYLAELTVRQDVEDLIMKKEF